MSREINSSAALLSAKPPSPSQTKKIEVPPTPKGPPPSIQREVIKKIEKLSDDQERVELYRKIRAYQKNERLKKHLSEFQEPPKKTDSLEALRNQYAEMTSSLKESSKRMMVMNTFESLLQFGEMGAIQFLQMPEKRGMASFLSSKKEELFQPELEELIIELSDDWVPSARTRLALKVVQACMAYSSRNLLIPEVAKKDGSPGITLSPTSEKSPEAGLPKAVPKRKS